MVFTQDLFLGASEII
jgi:hypothetical protein